MAKKLLITEKPSVAMEFAKVLKANGVRKNGYLESDKWVITWCVGHLVTMSYPEKYDEKYKYWRLDTLPFIPQEYKYEVIPAVENQFNIIKNLFSREDIDTIYVGTDSGREGEYIYRLVAQMINVQGKEQKRIWIDSQTEEEIIRGINVHCNTSPKRPILMLLIIISADTLSFLRAYIETSIAAAFMIRPANCTASTFKKDGIFTFLSNPAAKPYVQSSIVIKGSIDADGISVSKKLTAGEIAPAAAPATGPAKSPTSIIGRCIGRKASPKAVPSPEAAPIR